MKMTEIQLLQKLQKYGLRSNDWILIKPMNQLVRIQHKKEKTFSFIGTPTIKNGSADWKNIRLLSL